MLPNLSFICPNLFICLCLQVFFLVFFLLLLYFPGQRMQEPPRLQPPCCWGNDLVHNMVDVHGTFLGCHFLARNFLSLVPEKCATQEMFQVCLPGHPSSRGGAEKKYQTPLLEASAPSFMECGFTDTATKLQTALLGATAPCYVECWFDIAL